ncbi:amino-acid N-acetyltransferas-like protein subunit Mak10 [Lophiotrema nucula]|uniref:Amino-acid N-acetyltransferas-like protein subunit Mak10 n=1 Tax=Lophiotrema nucula TaxID=690887 RepID=A0A6A5ZGW1_9PLEO|nr:amino-acid N-acetyltransferas-like protein subunit Mak10 [Lophiotrema nucula]
MAEDRLGHATTCEDHITPIVNHDGTGASQEVRPAEKRLSAGLPLRQAMKPPLAEPKTYDITEKFTKACSALEVGQLVKDEYFTLFESIGALEIMDPKMDSGFLQPGETLEDAYDTLAPILPEELISILDQLLCHEIAWHTGYPLSQTLFTSVYIDKLLWPEPKTFEQAQFYRGEISDDRRPGLLLEVLRAYCLALVKCCDFTIARITSRDYFEEEDFCTHTYNRVLLVQTPMDVFQRELDAAIERLEDHSEMDIEASLRGALIARLKFRKRFLSALDIDFPIDYIRHCWEQVSRKLPTISTTHQLGKVVPESFSFKIQRRLASTVPPRPIVELEFKDAFEKLQQLCIDCDEATRFVDIEPDPLEYQSFLWAFASRTPTPLPYSRAYLASLLFQESSLNIPLIDLRSLVLPCSPVLDPTNWALSPPRNPMLPKPPRLQLALFIDEFVERAGQCYLDLWTALGQNRCRLRRMLTHVVTGWDQLQMDAGIVDEDIMRVVTEMGIREQVLEYPLTTWVYHKKLWMIEKVVLLGFEQDIYLHDEFAGMYLFLSSVTGRRRDLLTTIKAHFDDRKRMFLSQNTPEALTNAQETDDGTRYISSLLHDASGISALSSALSKFYTKLNYLNLLPRPTRPFSTEDLRYELRMKPFLTLTPPEVYPFADFAAQVQPYAPPFFDSPPPSFSEALRTPESWLEIEDSVKRAKEEFSAVKKLGAKAAKSDSVAISWVKDVQGVLASCVALGVAVAGVKAAVEEGEEGRELGIRFEIPGIGIGKRYAEGWVVGKVVKS